MKRLEHPQIELQIAPMIDVCFLLLFFYILTSKPVKQESDMTMTLPGTIPQEQTLEIPDEQRLIIQDNGQILLNDLPLDQIESHDLPALLSTL
jgi:biopolymer transport protein ExbD